MSTQQVSKFWYQRQPWTGKSFAQIDLDIVDTMAALVREHGQALPGVIELLTTLKQQRIKIGLATNAPARLVPTVLETLKVSDFFETTVSADEVHLSKPAPDIYLSALNKLGVSAKHAIAIEDTPTGMNAAKSAGINTIVVPDPTSYQDARFDQATLKVESLAAVNYQTLTTLCATNLQA